MIVYHGSNVIVSEPKLVHQNRFLDFGFGFYTTTNKVQAIGFADKVTRRAEKEQSASVYMRSMSRKHFPNALYCALISRMKLGSIMYLTTVPEITPEIITISFSAR